jgi:alkanesulfonate monooxygenase SsuD/methylene tetrahydromethanopterin reductase-like flavin-dependent oxidoreductase (luciferase family)
MRFGVAVPVHGGLLEPEDVAAIIDDAERLGYWSAWFADHLAVPPDGGGPFAEPLAACAWGLGATRRLVFGTDVLVLPYRHPLQVAAAIATAARLARPPDRLVLGVGIGHLRAEFAALAVDYGRRGALTGDALALLRAARGGTVNQLTVMPATVPIWVGGASVAARRRAATLADGWHPLWPDPADYRRLRAELDEARADAGQEGPFTWSYSCPFTSLGPPVRSDARGAAPSPPWYAPPFPVAEGGRLRFTGGLDELAEDVAALAEAGVEHVVLRFVAAARRGGLTAVREQLEALAPLIP